MAKTKISEYSSTANSNTDIASINIDEGCTPSGINNAIRALMAQLKDFQQGTNSDSFNGPVGSTTASTGAFTTLTTTSTINGLTVGKGAGAVSTNTAVGASALAANTTGGENTAIGNNSLKATDSSYNTAIGNNSQQAIGTGAANTSVGRASLYSNTSGTRNTAVGFNAASANTTGSDNVAVGGGNPGVTNGALGSNTTGSYNTAVGSQALLSNTTASYNTAVGYQAGYSNSTNLNCTFLGYLAGYSTTGDGNVFVGGKAGYSVTTATVNTFVGESAGYYITTGAKNTILGRYNGNQGGLDIRTASNAIVLSDGDGNPKLRFNAGEWHMNATDDTGRSVRFDGDQFFPWGDNLIKLGYPSFRWTTVYATTGTINTSDATQKQDIAALDDSEKRVAVAIKSLIKKYRFKDAVAEKGDAARIHVGAVAQEVQAAFVAEGLDPAKYALFCSDTWYEVDGKPSENLTEPYTADTLNAVEVTRLGLRYEELLSFVIAAM